MSPQRGAVKTEDSAKRVRAYRSGELIVDSIRPRLVWEIPYYPTYYFPEADVRSELLTADDHAERSPSRGDIHFFNLTAREATVERAAYTHPASPVEELRGYIAFRWDAIDHWFEEDEEVFVHARDPYKRVDVLRSTRRVEVVIGGETIADSSTPTLLFETGLPTRYYLPKTDVRLDLLTPSATRTLCPYKGQAEYWSATVDGEEYEDIVWSYRYPVHESEGIAGLLCFYNEKVDLVVDGAPQERPRTPFS